MDNHYSKSHKKSYTTPERMKIGTNGDCRVIDGFKWNIYDVCINPEEIVICDDKVKFLIIRLAKTDYSWEYGIDAGVGVPPCIWLPSYRGKFDNKSSTSREGALEKAIRHCLKSIKERKEWDKDMIDVWSGKLKKHLMQARQLDLFTNN